MSARRFTFAVLAIVLVTAACHKDPPPPPAPTGPTAAEIEAARRDSIARVEGRRADTIAAANAARDRATQAERDRIAAEQRGLRTTLEAMVHFDYDEADITADAERVLREKADILRANTDVQVRIEGHADERGSTEYNLALSSRRADAVKQFFAGFGLDAGRFTTTSFGEERPLVNRSDEDAWAQNRRAEFVITGGGANLRPER
jgi:peptidoglycan-associated lipoprotein